MFAWAHKIDYMRFWNQHIENGDFQRYKTEFDIPYPVDETFRYSSLHRHEVYLASNGGIKRCMFQPQIQGKSMSEKIPMQNITANIYDPEDWNFDAAGRDSNGYTRAIDELEKSQDWPQHWRYPENPGRLAKT